MPDNRRLWLIDAAYLFNSQATVRAGYQFDYLKLRKKIEVDGPFFEAHYLNSTQNPPSDQQDKFHTWLKSAPPNGPKLQVKLFRLKDVRYTCTNCQKDNAKQVQKGVDVGIATLALTLVDRYDTLVLSSGDGDFQGMVEHIRNVRNKRFELVVFNSGVSTDLQSLSDRIYWINEFADEVKRDTSLSNG